MNSMDSIHDEKGGVVVNVSREVADMLRDASIGLTDRAVVERCGIAFMTWRRAVTGQIVSDESYIKIAAGLEIDAGELLAAANRARGTLPDYEKLMMVVLAASPLTQSNRRELMSDYRRMLREKSGQKQITIA